MQPQLCSVIPKASILTDDFSFEIEVTLLLASPSTWLTCQNISLTQTAQVGGTITPGIKGPVQMGLKLCFISECLSEPS